MAQLIYALGPAEKKNVAKDYIDELWAG